MTRAPLARFPWWVQIWGPLVIQYVEKQQEQGRTRTRRWWILVMNSVGRWEGQGTGEWGGQGRGALTERVAVAGIERWWWRYPPPPPRRGVLLLLLLGGGGGSGLLLLLGGGDGSGVLLLSSGGARWWRRWLLARVRARRRTGKGGEERVRDYFTKCKYSVAHQSWHAP
jgi:hypothetical protein